jgi:hypothetical protein
VAVRCGDHKKRVGVGDVRGEERLSGFAESGFVGEEEGAVTLLDLFNEASLVPHQFHFSRGAQRGRLGQFHARGVSTGTVLEGAEQRLDELPVGEAVDPCRTLRDVAEVGREERVRHLKLANRLRDNLPVGGRVHRFRLGGDDQFVGAELNTRCKQEVATQGLRCSGDGSVIGKEGNQAGVASCRFGEDTGQSVKAFLLVGPFVLAEFGINLDASTLFAEEKRRYLEPSPVRGLEWSLLHGGLDLARGAGEDRDHTGIVGATRTTTLRRLT